MVGGGRSRSADRIIIPEIRQMNNSHADRYRTRPPWQTGIRNTEGKPPYVLPYPREASCMTFETATHVSARSFSDRVG